MEKKDRTKEDNDRMIHAAHTSRFHWGEIGTLVELERGEWQISRMSAVLNLPESSLYHARRCLEICTENGLGDWDIAFAHEAMTRASAIAGRKDECRTHVKLGEEAGRVIKDKEDRDYFFRELKTIGCRKVDRDLI